MTTSATQAWLAGLLLLLLAFGAWFVVVQTGEFAGLGALLLWASPFLSAALAAYLGPKRKLLLGTSMAIPASILAVVFNAAYQMLGHAVDFPGLEGGLVLFTTTLIFSGVLAGAGAVAGRFLSRNRG